MAKSSFGDRIGGLGVLGSTTTVQCSAESTSTYCRIVKAFNLLSLFAVVVFFIWLALKKK